MILSSALEIGLNFSVLGREIGVSRSRISKWKDGKTSPRNPQKVIKALNRKSNYLSQVYLSSYDDFNKICREIGLRESRIAEMIGLTRQALNARKQRDGVRYCLHELQMILRGIGKQLQILLKQDSLN